MIEDFERHMEETREKVKRLLDASTECEWTVVLINNKWDYEFEIKSINCSFLDFSWRSLCYEPTSTFLPAIIEEFGWDEIAIDIARLMLYSFNHRRFEKAMKTLGIKSHQMKNKAVSIYGSE